MSGERASLSAARTANPTFSFRVDQAVYSRPKLPCIAALALLAQAALVAAASADPHRVEQPFAGAPADVPAAVPDARPPSMRLDQRLLDGDRAAVPSEPRTVLEALFGRDDTCQDDGEPERGWRIDPDRPQLPEASTTVGKGRIVLEGGYPFTGKGSAFSSNSVPEALLRIGVFADWFELRIGQSFLAIDQTVAGVHTAARGAQDLYLGVEVALTGACPLRTTPARTSTSRPRSELTMRRASACGSPLSVRRSRSPSGIPPGRALSLPPSSDVTGTAPW
jgi:hypothetical protein